ncbi:hypothetical protein UAJ10_02945 [Nitrospirillum sp. BR 11164]|uniref:hypothetical protein n=1 Tax=Nitrospirillum sp. BR 11164 TaxID=3104324 RepID=UPI002AFE9942|nr:hypothetical protein [Nitrospirillum sp. BR 11164]MEA1647975.1 hypothetical protein [Nitrospirillum sp. BR 11164]
MGHTFQHLPRFAQAACLSGTILAAALAAGAARAQEAEPADSYVLGQGLNVGSVNLAGYSSLVTSLPDQGRKTLSLEDLSLYASAHVGMFVNPFMEAELTGLNLLPWAKGGDGGDGGKGGGYLVLERLYDDVQLPDGFTIRFGKMLAPVGDWNQIHAAPLVLSTIRPAATYRGFSQYATGLSVLYNDPKARWPDVQVYWQPMDEFSARPDSIVDDHYRLVEGLHVSFPLGLLDKVGFSVQRTIDRLGVEQHLGGVDFRYTMGPVTLQGEGVVSSLSQPAGVQAPRSLEWSAYVAPSYALDDRWSVYGWYEIYDGRGTASATAGQAVPVSDRTAQDVLAGFAFRPQPAMVFRLEYLLNVGGPPVNPTGLFASWSVLF